MTLTETQLNTIVARAFPADRLRETRALSTSRYALELTSRERLLLETYASAQAARAADRALRMLGNEFDLPLPVLRAADVDGETIGLPYTLLGGVSGEPLERVRAQLHDSELHAIGLRLGEVMQRVHRLAAEQFGPLGQPATSSDERAYGQQRLNSGLERAAANGLVSNTDAATLRGWFEAAFQPVARPAALIHGALGADTLLVRKTEQGWALGGVIGWEQALGWSPAWEHTIFLENTDRMRDFGLRVGYGIAYDERTQRTYEQVREVALIPYRALALLDGMCAAYEHGEQLAADRQRAALLQLVRSTQEKPTHNRKDVHG